MARSPANTKSSGMARKRGKIEPASAYSIMWIVVMFDLPVTSKLEMRRATRFRKSLLELGFVRKQFSVYMRHCANMERADVLAGKVNHCLVEDGHVSILFITDRQYSQVRNYFGKVTTKNENAELKKSEQLHLF